MALLRSFLSLCKEPAKDLQAVAFCNNGQSYPSNHERQISSAQRHSALRMLCQQYNGDENKPSKKKIANLRVHKNQTVPLPTHVSKTGVPRPISEFLSQRAGMESMLNISALQSHEYVGPSVFRCTLPKLEILNFEVAPIIDLSVVANEQECIVEMLACKFLGSEIVEKQNKRFSASMRNQLTWEGNGDGVQVLQVNVQLNVSLEVYTLPFTLLPLSAVETPGNIILQAMVDGMVPLFLEHLLDDYYHWSQKSEAIQTPEDEIVCGKSSLVLRGYKVSS